MFAYLDNVTVAGKTHNKPDANQNKFLSTGIFKGV